jgi:amidase
MEDRRTATQDRVIERHETQFSFDRDIEAVASVTPGEIFAVQTADSLCGIVKSELDTFRHFDEVFERLGGACPVTGPVYVEGARAGDVLAVTLHDIAPAPGTGRGWTAVIPGLGSLMHDQGYTLQPPMEPRSTICEVGRDEIVVPIDGKEVRIPARPFLGTVGIAPAQERRITFSQSREYLGDVDIPQLGRGATLLLRCNVDGGLLSLGDAHAAQGDAEITGVAIEIEADVTLSVDVLDADEAEYGSLPMLETDGWVGCVAGFNGVHTADCVRAGFVDLARRLIRRHGFTETGAYQLLGQVGRVQLGNMFDPFYSALTYIERRYLDS